MTQLARKFTTRRLICLVLCLAFLLAACSKPSPPPEPKALKIAYLNWKEQRPDFTFFKSALESKFPDYSFSYLDITDVYSANSLENLNSYLKYDERGIIADLIIEPMYVSTSAIFTQGYTYNMEAMLRGSSIDLSTFESEYLDHLRALSEDGSLLALPLSANRYAMRYLVDELSVEQKEALQTWPQTVELSKKAPLPMSLQYLWTPISNQYGLEYINGQDEVALNQDRWLEVLGQVRALLPDSSSSSDLYPVGTESRTFSFSRSENWDLLPFPQIDNENETGPHRLMRIVAIGPSTRQLEDAVEVLTYLTSYEYQLAQARAGIASVLDRPEVQEQFGADSPIYTGKNVAAFFQTKPSQPSQYISKYDRLDGDFTRDRSTIMLNTMSPILEQMIDEPLEPSAAYELIEHQLTSFLDRIKQRPVDSY